MASSRDAMDTPESSVPAQPSYEQSLAPARARPSVFLHPGRLFVSAEPFAIQTILGSCIAVCLWDSGLRIGGVNHYLLPHGGGNGPSSLRFGNIAIEELIRRILALGADKRRLRAKVFGGACVLESFQHGSNQLGHRNVQMARRILSAEGIRLLSEDTGGNHGRKLIFHTDSGSAWVRRL